MPRGGVPWALVRVVSTRWLLRAHWPGRAWVGAAAPLAVGALAWVVLPAAAGGAVLAVSAVAVLAVVLALRVPAPVAVAVLGLAVAGASLSTVLAASRGVQGAIVRALASVNGHLLVTKYGLDFREYESVAARVRAMPGVRAVSPFAYAPVAVVKVEPGTGWTRNEARSPGGDGTASATAGPGAGGDGEVGAPVMALGKGVDPRHAAEFRGLARVLVRGDLGALRPGDSRHVPGLALGVRLAARLGVGPGDHVRVVVPREIRGSRAAPGPPRFATFQVLDLARTGTEAVDAHLVLMHLSAAQALFFAERRVTGIEAQIDDPAAAPALARTLEADLPPAFRVTPWQRTHAGFLRSAQQVTAAVGIVVALLVVVSAGLVLSAVLLAVRRRRPQLAALRALGADGRAVAWIVVATGAWIGLAGALGGAALATVWTRALAHASLALDPAVYPVDALAVDLGLRELLLPQLAAAGAALVACAPIAASSAARPPRRDLTP